MVRPVIGSRELDIVAPGKPGEQKLTKETKFEQALTSSTLKSSNRVQRRSLSVGAFLDLWSGARINWLRCASARLASLG